MNSTNPLWAFFGTTEFSVIVLEELKASGFLPSLIVTVEDKPKGRKLLLTKPPVKVWAEKEQIQYIQPKTLRDIKVLEEIKNIKNLDFFIVFSYGKIIPKEILGIPALGAINLHPSLLPKLRGPSPIKSAILKENETGLTIIKMDEEMDHGPIIVQKKIDVLEWPPYENDLETLLAHEGGKLLASIIPDWINNKIKETEQDHSKATFCQKIEKTDGELNLEDSPEINLRKIRAYHVWPGAHFFDKSNKRIIVRKARIEENNLIIERVVPEGKKEMSYSEYLLRK